MKIDIDLMEEIRQYTNGELPASEAAIVAQKIQSDDRYAFHYRAFRSAAAGIRQAMLEGDRSEQDIAEGEDPEVTDPEKIRQLLQQDRAEGQRRLRWTLLSTAAVIALLIFGWIQWSGIATELESIPSDRPIAVDELEEDEPIGSPGNRILKTISADYLSSDGQKLDQTGAEVEVIIQKTTQPKLEYVFSENSLVLFTHDPKVIDELNIQYLKVRTGDGWADFLRLGTELYPIQEALDRTPLLKSPEGSYPDAIRQLQ